MSRVGWSFLPSLPPPHTHFTVCIAHSYFQAHLLTKPRFFVQGSTGRGGLSRAERASPLLVLYSTRTRRLAPSLTKGRGAVSYFSRSTAPSPILRRRWCSLIRNLCSALLCSASLGGHRFSEVAYWRGPYANPVLLQRDLARSTVQDRYNTRVTSGDGFDATHPL